MLDEWALSNSHWKKKLAWHLYARKSMFCSDCIHALTERELADVRRIGYHGPVAVIPNFCNVSNTKVKKIRDTARETKNIGYLGRLHPKKGLENLLHAWAMLGDAGWQLNIAGPDENNHKNQLERMISKLNLRKNVKISDSLYGQEKDDFYNDLDAFILPTLSEGLPMALVEALMFELPCVTTHESNLPVQVFGEVVEFCEPEPDSILAALKNIMIKSSRDLAQIGRQSRALANRYYSETAVLTQYIETYDWLINPDTQAPDCINFND
jgi:poly(glycerol-phosphate) alpha-glucosyltransferase